MATRIIRAGQAHLDLILPLFTAYREFYEQPAAPAAERAFLAERLGAAEAVIFVALDEDDRALGFVQLFPSFDSVYLEAVWILHDLFVDEDCRGAGVGRELMEAAHEFCRGTGAGRVDLATAQTNSRAKPLYESLGYELDDEFHYYSLSL